MPYEYNTMKYIQRNNIERPLGKYKQKLALLKQMIREYVHENAALVDEVEEVQMNIIVRKEERKFLLRKLCDFEPQVTIEVQKAAKDTSSPRLPSGDSKKRKKKIYNENTSKHP